MKAAWSDEPRVSFEGRFRQVADLPIMPKPVQRPHPPIWFGAGAPRSIARAVRHGDAFLGAGSTTTAAFAEHAAMVRQELDRQGRDAERFTIGKRVYLMVDDDPARARERVLEGLRRVYGPMPGIEDVPVSGTPQEVADGVRAVLDAGAEMVLLHPLGADVAEDREQLERLASEVIPQLAG
jgi:alkanesulfonate monooxygenase SsuD/methylene tetrahydromethanopterin reductase-like flavin-dependent oxidoreductase (luciferase family)